MVQLPSSLVDFADALKTLVASQSDVTQLVTKWDEIVNTDTPRTVKITLSDGTEHSVDNLAKIRNDLIEGLSLDEPTVSALKFNQYRERGMIRANRWWGKAFHLDGENAFESGEGWIGAYRNLRNDFNSVCMPDKAVVRANMMQMPRIVYIGAVKDRGIDPVDTVDFYITAPSATYVTNDEMVPSHYDTMVTFVNRNFGRAENPNYAGADVTVRLHDEQGTFTVERVIPPAHSATFILFAAPGLNTMNVNEVIPVIP